MIQRVTSLIIGASTHAILIYLFSSYCSLLRVSLVQYIYTYGTVLSIIKLLYIYTHIYTSPPNLYPKFPPIQFHRCQLLFLSFLSEKIVIVMSGEETQRNVFGAETASSLVKELRDNFGKGTTRSYEWRVSQVKALLKAVVENEDQIVGALCSDLAKPPLETVVYEVLISNQYCTCLHVWHRSLT